MKYKDILIQLASMTVPYVYDNTISFLELDRKLYKIVHELIVAMQGLNEDYEQFKSDMTDSFNEFTTTINNNFDNFKTDVNNQINTFEENMNSNFESFKTEIEGSFNTLEGKFNTLKSYVDNYFENLNLDEEVQTVIQKMVSDGTLASIINDELLADINNQITEINQEIEQLQNNQTKSLVVKYSAQINRNVYYNSELNNSVPLGTILYVTLDGAPTQPTSKVQIGSSISSTNDLYDKDYNLVYGNMVKDNMNLVIIKDIMKWRLINTLPSEYDTTALEEQIEQNTSNISSLQTQVGTNTTNISDLQSKVEKIITNCGTGIVQQNEQTYYIYSEAFGTPTDKQLFTIQMLELAKGSYDVKFYNASQSGSYNGWLLNNVKASDVSKQLLLVQASVVEEAISFNVVGVLPPTYNFSLMDADNCNITTTPGSVTDNIMKATLIGTTQRLLMGSFMVQNTTSATITIAPPVHWGTGRFKEGDVLYAQKISVIDNNISLTNLLFRYSASNNNFTASFNGSSNKNLILIMPQYFLDGAQS